MNKTIHPTTTGEVIHDFLKRFAPHIPPIIKRKEGEAVCSEGATLQHSNPAATFQPEAAGNISTNLPVPVLAEPEPRRHETDDSSWGAVPGRAIAKDRTVERQARESTLEQQPATADSRGGQSIKEQQRIIRKLSPGFLGADEEAEPEPIMCPRCESSEVEKENELCGECDNELADGRWVNTGDGYIYE